MFLSRVDFVGRVLLWRNFKFLLVYKRFFFSWAGFAGWGFMLDKIVGNLYLL